MHKAKVGAVACCESRMDYSVYSLVRLTGCALEHGKRTASRTILAASYFSAITDFWLLPIDAVVVAMLPLKDQVRGTSEA